MPSRSATAPRAIASILPEVDRLCPRSLQAGARVRGRPRVRILRSQVTGQRPNGKLRPSRSTQEPFTFFGVDDGIEYPHDYCMRLVATLARYRGAVVGVHAGVLAALSRQPPPRLRPRRLAHGGVVERRRRAP